MQDGVREDRVELTIEREVFGANLTRIDAAGSRRDNHGFGRIDADDDRAASGDLHGERAVAATQIEDALARLRIQPIDERRAERRNECRMVRVLLRAPCLRASATCLCR